MTRQQAPARANLVLAVLFAGAFVMGCAEMLVVGMLDLIATDLEVSVSAAGALVTANALGLALGGPLLTFLTTGSTAGSSSSHATVSSSWRTCSRPSAPTTRCSWRRGFCRRGQGLFIAAAIVTATSVVPPERAGRAMASSSPASRWRVPWAFRSARCWARPSAGAAPSSRSS